jgi:acetyl-CoA C-acetyltransferase
MDQCAGVVVKNRRNALKNPLASFPADLSVDEVLNGPPLAWPLSRRETSEHVDGAVVMVLASGKRAAALAEKPVWILGAGWCNGSASLESRDWSALPYLEKAARMAYRQAGIKDPWDEIDFAEVDDTYAYKELQSLEALGLCGFGEAGMLLEQGTFDPDGEFPVNVSGGSLGVGSLLDGTGLHRALEAVLQLRGEAGARQLEDASIGLVQSWRGVPTTSGAVAVLSN